MTNTIAKRQNGSAYAADFGNVVDSIFQNSMRRFFDANFWDARNELTSGTVPVNVRELEHQYELDVIAPGCRKEDFNIKVQDHVLTISLQVSAQKQDPEKQGWVRNEWIQRPFSRSFTLDDTVDIEKINARYADGILTITLQKSAQANSTSRSIAIH